MDAVAFADGSFATLAVFAEAGGACGSLASLLAGVFASADVSACGLSSPWCCAAGSAVDPVTSVEGSAGGACGSHASPVCVTANAAVTACVSGPGGSMYCCASAFASAGS